MPATAAADAEQLADNVPVVGGLVGQWRDQARGRWGKARRVCLCEGRLEGLDHLVEWLGVVLVVVGLDLLHHEQRVIFFGFLTL